MADENGVCQLPTELLTRTRKHLTDAQAVFVEYIPLLQGSFKQNALAANVILEKAVLFFQEQNFSVEDGLHPVGEESILARVDSLKTVHVEIVSLIPFLDTRGRKHFGRAKEEVVKVIASLEKVL